MNKIQFADIPQLLENLNVGDLWFMAERCWTAESAKKILAFEREKRNNEGAKLDPLETGFCLIKKPNWQEIDYENYLRFYIFNSSMQFHFRRSEDGESLFCYAKIEDCHCNDVKTIQPIQIHNHMKEFRFASLLGTIPADNVLIKQCTKCNSWRFSHE